MPGNKLSKPDAAGTGSPVMGAVRFAAFLGLVALIAPVQIAILRWRPKASFAIPKFFHRILAALLGFRIRAQGRMATGAPVFFVANHTSYLDIPVLGALIPAAFVAKKEVESWPLFGMMARLQRTVFVERRAARAQDQGFELRERLESGESVILFPEGTSSDGLAVLAFKSSMFSAVEKMGPESKIMVQPVSIACTELDGLPLTRAMRPYYSWYGDMTLPAHLWNVFRMGRFTVDVVFHSPVRPDSFAGRKPLAFYCQQQVARGIEQCLAGREGLEARG